ncbi:MAG: alpha/beta fold hydrolase [Clostridia bacterium]|nr:alpha/beta fold hydrolase [Clostridia bacterium]
MKKWNNREFPSEWHKYPYHEGEFMGQPYILVCPKDVPANGKWVLKTEYFGAFPETEFALLERGYHVAHIHNVSRWCPDEVTETQAAFVHFVHSQFNLSETCVPIGMSCGGMQAIFLAAKYPETVSCMFIDSPALNFLSSPFGFGKKNPNDTVALTKEFIAHRNIDEIAILSFRHHPLDYLPQLVENKIPTIMVVGACDTALPYEENGLLLKEAYEKAGNILETYVCPGRGHHPHGLEDNTPIVSFIERYSK